MPSSAGTERRTRRLGAALGSALLAFTLLTAGSATATAAASTTDTSTSISVAASTSPDNDPVASPPGANDWSCRPTAAHPYPVVLVHGTFANRYENWLALSPLLKHQGYCVFALDYGTVPGLTSAGSGLILPIGGLAPVAESAAQLAGFVDLVRSVTGASKVDVVGHSQGGMLPNYYLKYLGGAAKVDTLVGLAPDNHGTTLDGLAKLAPYLPGVADLLYTACPSCRDQVAGSDFVQKLNAGGDTVPGVHYTVISTIYDEVVTPYRTQFLSGPDVHNITVQDSCWLAVPEHVLIAFDPTALHHVTNALDPAHAIRVSCG